jgi:hypothetical protein
MLFFFTFSSEKVTESSTEEYFRVRIGTIISDFAKGENETGFFTNLPAPGPRRVQPTT